MINLNAKNKTQFNPVDYLSEFNTPILFLVFNRPDTVKQVLERISQIKPKLLFIAADGPRENVKGEQERCNEVRTIVENISWNCEVKYLYQKKNLGCGKAVSTAISWFFDNVEEGIVLEDDCLPDLTFFSYCQELLVKYRNIEPVMFISGTSPQSEISFGNDSYYFTKYANIWGWASWRRVWEKYDFNMNDLEEDFKKPYFKNVLNNKSERRFWLNKFRKVKSLIIDTWDYQLLYALWKNKGLSISPNVNLIKNIGFENMSTHKFLKDSKKTNTDSSMDFPLVHPKIEIHEKADTYIFSNLYSHSFKRIFRLIIENGVFNTYKYIIKS